MSQTWDDAKDLLARALEYPPPYREAFVRASGASPKVVAEVLGLLSEASTTGGSTFPALAALPEEPELPPGTRIGTYIVIDTIAAGGMGRVYLARDPTLQRRVAIKSLRGPDPEGAAARSVIQREAASAAQITNPHVATIHGIFQEQGRSYIVMEYVDGEALSQVLRRGKLPVARVLEIGVQLAKGLAAAHAKGVIHRDLKPANIQLTADGTAKILDFGIASVKGTLTTRHAGNVAPDVIVQVAGTPGYMSPEQWQRRRIDERSDIFSLGLVLFEMATGRRALGPDPISDQTPTLPRADSSDRKVPRAVADAISRAVAIDPAERFTSANELREALEQVQRQVATPWWQELVGTGFPAVARVVSGVVILAALCIALGYVSTTTFNFALERRDYAQEGVGTWFAWGRRSVVVVALIALALGAAIGLLVVLRNFLVATSGGLRTRDQNIRTHFDRLTSHAPGQAAVLPSLIVLVFGIWLAITWWAFAPYFCALTTPITNAAPEQFVLLGPGHLIARNSVEISFTLLTIAAAGSAIWLGRSRAASTHRAPMFASWAIASLALISLQLPYQFNHPSRKMPLAEWKGEQCYVVGTREDTGQLLCCPTHTPRLNRIPSANTADIKVSDKFGQVYEGLALARR